eukprot:TRINITY_DN7448_c0_g1_i1.p1 TRINITY_DN7448_c0_g1~~TRINITY_DN7448_c0_g1_i1.p1  ORF type:complete len:663 (+),score=18.56 TRINITY_DN7448_c0_g1_i1:299-2287(+)
MPATPGSDGAAAAAAVAMRIRGLLSFAVPLLAILCASSGRGVAAALPPPIPTATPTLTVTSSATLTATFTETCSVGCAGGPPDEACVMSSPRASGREPRCVPESAVRSPCSFLLCPEGGTTCVASKPTATPTVVVGSPFPGLEARCAPLPCKGHSSELSDAEKQTCCTTQRLWCGVPPPTDCLFRTTLPKFELSAAEMTSCCKWGYTACPESHSPDCSGSTFLTPEDRRWCCARVGKGCPPPVPTLAVVTPLPLTAAECVAQIRLDPSGGGVAAGCCGNHGVGCPSRLGVTDCLTADLAEGSAEQKRCCAEQGIGCGFACHPSTTGPLGTQEQFCCETFGVLCGKSIRIVSSPIPESMGTRTFRLSIYTAGADLKENPKGMTGRIHRALLSSSATLLAATSGVDSATTPLAILRVVSMGLTPPASSTVPPEWVVSVPASWSESATAFASRISTTEPPSARGWDPVSISYVIASQDTAVLDKIGSEIAASLISPPKDGPRLGGTEQLIPVGSAAPEMTASQAPPDDSTGYPWDMELWQFILAICGAALLLCLIILAVCVLRLPGEAHRRGWQQKQNPLRRPRGEPTPNRPLRPRRIPQHPRWPRRGWHLLCRRRPASRWICLLRGRACLTVIPIGFAGDGAAWCRGFRKGEAVSWGCGVAFHR